MSIDYAPTKLVRPTGVLSARWIGAVGDTGLVHIRVWQMDRKTGRNTPVQTTAHYCQKHNILYLTSDYPNGCPNCIGASISG